MAFCSFLQFYPAQARLSESIWARRMGMETFSASSLIREPGPGETLSLEGGRQPHELG